MPPSHTPADDFVGYLRSFTADVHDEQYPLENVWDRYHAPGADHVVNRKRLDQPTLLKNLAQSRADRSPYELSVHEAVVDGNRAAARYTVSRDLVWQLRYNTEVVIFADLAEDGRVASTVATARMTYGRGPDGESWDSDARPAPVPGARHDPAHYLTTFTDIANDPRVPLAEAFDRFHTPDAVQYINGTSMQRPAVLQALTTARERKSTHTVDIHTALTEGNSFALRYTLTPTGTKRRAKELDVFAFGEFAGDGRVRLLRSVMQSESGDWPT